MDIRIRKTRRSIVNAFLELRAYQPLEKITVKELCEKAEINKSTFYKHYTDIFDLSSKLESKTIENILENLPHPEYILNRPKEFMEEMLAACFSQSTIIDRLFSGNQSGQLILKLNAAIKEMVFKFYPQYRNSEIANIYLTYAIYGGFYAMRENMESDSGRIINVLGQITEKSSEILLTLASQEG